MNTITVVVTVIGLVLTVGTIIWSGGRMSAKQEVGLNGIQSEVRGLRHDLRDNGQITSSNTQLIARHDERLNDHDRRLSALEPPVVRPHR